MQLLIDTYLDDGRVRHCLTCIARQYSPRAELPDIIPYGHFLQYLSNGDDQLLWSKFRSNYIIYKDQSLQLEVS